MALAASTQWETQPGGSDSTNSGGFNPANASMAADLAVVSGGNTASPVVSSASYNFAAADQGYHLFVQSGANLQPGWYRIVTCNGNGAEGANQATLDAAAGHVALWAGSKASGLSTSAGVTTNGSPSAGAVGTWTCDYSQNTSPRFTYNDLATASGTPSRVQSATYNIGWNCVGNVLNVTGGTGFTTGKYEIQSYPVTVTYAQADRSLGGAGLTNGAGYLGGCFATAGYGAGAMASGNTLWLRTSTYTHTSASANVSGGYMDPPAGTAAAPTVVSGYNAYRTDLDPVYNYANFPAVQNSASGNTTALRLTNNFVHLRNLVVDSNNSGAYGVYCAGSNNNVKNVKSYNGTSVTNGAFYFGGSPNSGERLWAAGVPVGYNLAGSVVRLKDCVATACTSAGASVTTVNTYVFLTRFIAYANTGATTDGFSNATLGAVLSLENCVFYGNGRGGVRVAGVNIYIVENNIFEGNTGNGVTNTATTVNDAPHVDYNYFYNNAANYSGFSLPYANGTLAGPHDALLAGSAFNPGGPAAGNFSTNPGTACRAGGYPGVFPGGLTTAYLDAGAAQHADPAGGGGGTSGPVNFAF